MKNTMNNLTCFLILFGGILMLSNSCKTNDNINIPTPLTDIDGNIYHNVTIGTQVWMVENLKTTKYRNGDPIPNITDQQVWKNLTTGGYCNFSNDTTKSNLYGRLYNWFAVNDNRSIAPKGWHVPSDAEWTTLVAYLGGQIVAGGKMKVADSRFWCYDNVGSTNESGFTALPGGTRTDLYFDADCQWGTWWSATVNDTISAFNMILFNNNTNINRVNNNKIFGMSVRCIKD